MTTCIKKNRAKVPLLPFIIFTNRVSAENARKDTFVRRHFSTASLLCKDLLHGVSLLSINFFVILFFNFYPFLCFFSLLLLILTFGLYKLFFTFFSYNFLFMIATFYSGLPLFKYPLKNILSNQILPCVTLSFINLKNVFCYLNKHKNIFLEASCKAKKK